MQKSKLYFLYAYETWFVIASENKNWKYINSQSKGKRRNPKYTDGLPKEGGPAVQCIERYYRIGVEVTIVTVLN